MTTHTPLPIEHENATQIAATVRFPNKPYNNCESAAGSLITRLALRFLRPNWKHINYACNDPKKPTNYIMTLPQP